MGLRLLGNQPTYRFVAVYTHEKTPHANYDFYTSSKPSPKLKLIGRPKDSFQIERLVSPHLTSTLLIWHVCESDLETPARLEKGTVAVV